MYLNEHQLLASGDCVCSPLRVRAGCLLCLGKMEQAPQMIYFRRSHNTLFILPAIAVGTDADQRPFFEVAWLCWAIGIGDKP